MKNKMLLLASAAVLMSFPAFAEDMSGKGDDKGMHKGFKFEAMDTNGDGLVSKDEFMAEHMKRFEAMDSNHDGGVSKDEIEAYRQAKHEKMKEMKEMKEMDGMNATAEGAKEGGEAKPAEEAPKH